LDIESLLAHTRRLLALPQSVKESFHKSRSPHFRGWEEVGSELTNNQVDMREQVDFYREYPVCAPDVQPPYMRLLGPNLWPQESQVPGLREAVSQWLDDAHQICCELLGMLAQGIGHAPDAITKRLGTQPMSFTKLIHYPMAPRHSMGVNAHKDQGFLTLLIPDSAGLEVLRSDGTWIAVLPRPGAVVVNLGEMLQAMSANYYVATLHRVKAPEHTRHTIAYFHGGSLDTTTEALSLCGDHAAAVARSPHHAQAGFMPSVTEMDSAVAKGTAAGSANRTYGASLWRYFGRAYPHFMKIHYPTTSRL